MDDLVGTSSLESCDLHVTVFSTLIEKVILGFQGPGRTMANLLKCPEFLRTCLTPKMSETSLRYRV